MGGRAEVQACTDPGARTPIGVSGNFGDRMPGAVVDGHLSGLAVTPLDPAVLLHVDVGQLSNDHRRKTFVK